jgi:hypothetical protein
MTATVTKKMRRAHDIGRLDVAATAREFSR